MSVSVISLEHVNVRVAPEVEEATKHFYGTVLGMQEVPKPAELRSRGGAWYELGAVQLHLSRDPKAGNECSKRHICILVTDLGRAEQELGRAGVEVYPDEEPVAGSPRFYIRDPGGNLIEVAQQRD